MQLRLTAGRVLLEQPHDFRSFRVVINGRPGREEVERAFEGVASFEGDAVAWVSQDALRGWPGLAPDTVWRGGLEQMIEKARPHGWIDDARGVIRGHLVHAQQEIEA